MSVDFFVRSLDFDWKNSVGAMKDCVVGASTSVFSTLPRLGGHCQNEWPSLKHDKQSLFSATSFALSVGVFFLNTGHLHRGCFYAGRASWRIVGLLFRVYISLIGQSCCGKHFGCRLGFRYTRVVFSSTLVFHEAVFIRSWASALSFNQSLKSTSVHRTCFFHVRWKLLNRLTKK